MPRNVTAESLGIAVGSVAKVTRDGKGYSAILSTGENVTDKIASHALKNAFRAQKALKLVETKTGGTRWIQVSPIEFDILKRGETISNMESESINIAQSKQNTDDFATHDDFVKFVKNSESLKPAKIRIDNMWWRFAIRSVLRGANLLVVGPSGCGKTLLANALKLALGKQNKFFYVNIGATQDPRSTLIGNTHYSPDKGTFVSLSYFAQAIQVPGALILLDEISRGHPDATNILMTVLDKTQRYLRVDEKADSQTIKVADGVSFILTANIGAEYTGTRIMDRALLDRCTIFEMQPLSGNEEYENLKFTFPTVQDKHLKAISEIAGATRLEIKSEVPHIETIVSTRMAEEMASMIHDGFTLEEAANTCVYPFFSNSGGTESPRAFMKTLVQKFFSTDFDSKTTVNQTAGGTNTPSTPWG